MMFFLKTHGKILGNLRTLSKFHLCHSPEHFDLGSSDTQFVYCIKLASLGASEGLYRLAADWL